MGPNLGLSSNLYALEVMAVMAKKVNKYPAFGPMMTKIAGFVLQGLESTMRTCSLSLFLCF